MITPNYLEEVARKAEHAVSDMQLAIIRRIAKRLTATIENYGQNILIASNLNDVRKLESAGMVYADVQKAIEDALPEFRDQVREAFKNGAKEVETWDGKIRIPYDGNTPQTQITTPQGTYDESTKATMESAFRRTNGEIYNLTQTTASEAQTDYIEALDHAVVKVKQGVSLDTAIHEAIQEVADTGLTTIYYDSGHVDRMEVAIARAIRTGINQMNADIVLTKCAELGVNYVRVSSHLGARVTKKDDFTNHSWWQGKVYHLDWASPVLAKYARPVASITDDKYKGHFPEFDVCGFGHIQGLCGINCRHTFSMFFPNLQDATPDKIDPKQNAKRYEATQKARTMERAIRAMQRRLYAMYGQRDALKEINVDTSEIDAQIKVLTADMQRKIAEYNIFCKKNSISRANWRLETSLTGR